MMSIKHKISYGVVLLLAGLLITYHIAKLYSVYFAIGSESQSAITHWQSVFRVSIIFGLVDVLLRWPRALVVMWIGIAALVGSQIVAYLVSNSLEIASFLSAIGYMKGFIIPSIITLMRPSPT